MKIQFRRKFEKTILLSTVSFLILNLGISASLSEFDLSNQLIQNAYAGPPSQFRLFAHDNNNGQIVEINPASGQATVVGATSLGPGASALASVRTDLNLACGNFLKGTHFGIIAEGGIDKIVTVDTSTGTATPVTDTDVGLGGRGVGFDDAGIFYATDATNNGQLYTVNICTAAKTQLASPIGFAGVDNIQWDPVSQTFLGLTSNNVLISVNPGTGAGAVVAALQNVPSGFQSCTIARDPGTTIWYTIDVAPNRGDLYTLDINSGALGFVGSKNNANVGVLLCGTAFEEVPSIIIGGEIIPIDSAALLVAGAQTSALWLIPIVLSVVAVGVVLVRRN